MCQIRNKSNGILNGEHFLPALSLQCHGCTGHLVNHCSSRTWIIPWTRVNPHPERKLHITQTCQLWAYFPFPVIKMAWTNVSVQFWQTASQTLHSYLADALIQSHLYIAFTHSRNKVQWFWFTWVSNLWPCQQQELYCLSHGGLL